MNKEKEAQVLEAFEPYRRQESTMRFADLLRARVEVYRDRLEKEESSQMRGRIKEIRDLLRIIYE
jgi:hypothetical protein